MNTVIKEILLIDDVADGVEEKLQVLQEDNSKRLETLVGVCGRLKFVDQIRGLPFVGNTQTEKKYFLYQTDRLSTYLTTTCIDVITGEHYQPYHQWLEASYEAGTLGDIWDQAVAELSQRLTPESAATAFVNWTKKLHRQAYKETTSIRKAFRDFVRKRDDWLRNWLLQTYIVEELDANFNPKTSWQVMDDEQKCRNIAHYLYDLRNLFTHTVVPYQPMDLVQRHNSRLPDKYRVKGFVAIFFPPASKDEPHRRISLPEDKRESDLIRLLVITWIRTHWLGITTDSESFIQRYWNSRAT